MQLSVMEIPVLYEDKYLLVVSKPQGLMSEPDAVGHENVADSLIAQLGPLRGNNILRNVHRLDRPVSGALLLARKASVLKLLTAQFTARRVDKKYWAVVSAPPSPANAELRHWLEKDNMQHKAVIYDKPRKKTDEVILRYATLQHTAGKSLLEIELVTGKYHQIRAQLAHIGCPIIGDEKYGSAEKYKPNAIALHARSLRFKHPIEGQAVEVLAAVPADSLWAAFG
ncbi:MAG: RluA family pseudouridine synthase [Bacteroidetes bacterium]|nr:RluA family pseudouridine synthase [Bacteroidota bacterium]